MQKSKNMNDPGNRPRQSKEVVFDLSRLDALALQVKDDRQALAEAINPRKAMPNIFIQYQTECPGAYLGDSRGFFVWVIQRHPVQLVKFLADLPRLVAQSHIDGLYWEIEKMLNSLTARLLDESGRRIEAERRADELEKANKSLEALLKAERIARRKLARELRETQQAIQNEEQPIPVTFATEHRFIEVEA